MERFCRGGRLNKQANTGVAEVGVVGLAEVDEHGDEVSDHEVLGGKVHVHDAAAVQHLEPVGDAGDQVGLGLDAHAGGPAQQQRVESGVGVVRVDDEVGHDMPVEGVAGVSGHVVLHDEVGLGVL